METRHFSTSQDKAKRAFRERVMHTTTSVLQTERATDSSKRSRCEAPAFSSPLCLLSHRDKTRFTMILQDKMFLFYTTYIRRLLSPTISKHGSQAAVLTWRLVSSCCTVWFIRGRDRSHLRIHAFTISLSLKLFPMHVSAHESAACVVCPHCKLPDPGW